MVTLAGKSQKRPTVMGDITTGLASVTAIGYASTLTIRRRSPHRETW